MKFEEMKKQQIELYSVGGQIVTVGDLVQEIRLHRRDNFFNRLFSVEEGKSKSSFVFDAIGFLAAMEDFNYYFNLDDVNYEGFITYDVIAGSDWVWHCKTTITWVDCYPVAFGSIAFHTTAVANENVNMDRIYAMNGTGLELRVIKKDLKVISPEDALEKSRRNNCK